MTSLFDKSSVGSSTISKTKHHIAGIEVTIYGASEISSSTTSISCLFLLHPRLETLDYVDPIALRCLESHHSKLKQSTQSESSKGLIIATFDQRNHGSRLVSTKANESWRSGNELHAIDMFGIYQGTANDVSLLIDHIPSYIFPDKNVTEWMCAGVSLGGHATWLSLVNEPRVTAGVVVIGCPDFERVMVHRAEKSRLPSFTEGFIGSKDYPKSLEAAVGRNDPTGVLVKGKTEDQRRKLIEERLGGKKVLILSGGADKLVPYSCSQPFIEMLERDGKGIVDVRNIVYEGVGHDCTEAMVAELVSFFSGILDEKGSKSKVCEALPRL